MCAIPAAIADVVCTYIRVRRARCPDRADADIGDLVACIETLGLTGARVGAAVTQTGGAGLADCTVCLLYTSDAADE